MSGVEIIPSLLASDSHRGGGGIAIIISKSDRKSDGKRIQQIGYAGSDERYVCDTE